MSQPRFDASFVALDCYTQPISEGFHPAKLVQPFDVVSMQFCMHYAFETERKARCMLENVSRYLRPGGIFIGTIPNAELLLCVDVVLLQIFMHHADIFPPFPLVLVPCAVFPHSSCRENLDSIPLTSDELSFGNSVYKITFESRERLIFGQKYWFFLQDAVENVPEYVVHWDNFVK